jgi:hypothetical protein
LLLVTDSSTLLLVRESPTCLKAIPNQGKHDVKLCAVGGSKMWNLTSLIKQVLVLNTFVDEKCSVTAIVNDEVRTIESFDNLDRMIRGKKKEEQIDHHRFDLGKEKKKDQEIDRLNLWH